jgi:uncharacterized protein (TIGR02284 family)
MPASTDSLTFLHTALIDSRNGYEEAVKDAEGKGLTPLFRDMVALRDRDAAELGQHLKLLGVAVDESGSFMSSVHRAVINFRSIFTELDEGVLPGLVDGEERILGYYNDAMETTLPGSSENTTLIAQRRKLQSVLADMKDRSSVKA